MITGHWATVRFLPTTVPYPRELMTENQLRQYLSDLGKRKRDLEIETLITEKDLTIAKLEAKVSDLLQRNSKVESDLQLLRDKIEKREEAIREKDTRFDKLQQNLSNCANGFHTWSVTNGKQFCIHCKKMYPDNFGCHDLRVVGPVFGEVVKCSICGKTYTWCKVCHKLKPENERCRCEQTVDETVSTTTVKKKHEGHTHCINCGMSANVWDRNPECKPTTVE